MIPYLVAGVVLLAALIYLATRPGKFTVEEKIFIKAPRAKVFDRVLNFASWNEWSPWAIHELAMKNKWSKNRKQVGGSYSWQGKHLGAGSLTHSEINAPEQIKQELKFFKGTTDKVVTAWAAEWRFAAATRKVGRQQVAGTEVTWLLHGCMPFVFWFMVPMIKRGVANDYKLGLLFLAQGLDKGAPRLKISFVGERNLRPSYGIYESFSGALRELPAKSAKGFAKLAKRIKKQGLRPRPPAFNAFWESDMKQRTAACDFVRPLDARAMVNSGVKDGKTYPGGKYFKVRYRGPYDYLEQVWNAGLGHLRMKKIKLNKRLPSLQVYEVGPRRAKSPNDLMTVLFIPIK